MTLMSLDMGIDGWTVLFVDHALSIIKKECQYEEAIHHWNRSG